MTTSIKFFWFGWLLVFVAAIKSLSYTLVENNAAAPDTSLYGLSTGFWKRAIFFASSYLCLSSKRCFIALRDSAFLTSSLIEWFTASWSFGFVLFPENWHLTSNSDKTSCGDPAKDGSPTVFVNSIKAHRQGDATEGHDSWSPTSAETGSSNVFAN